ncbi:MAG: hypothetical protein D6698_02195 [Gammaproteobacteria bacterium]|nr:MAG: hypothetical protein D6698_02195 [Gammaproteobacteria bacterium]
MNRVSHFLGYLLLAVLLQACATSSGQMASDGDSGFGGTGKQVASLPEEGESGFGGTGLIGTISEFGSIWVNGVEVDYPEDVRIVSNLGGPARLQLGQLVYLETDSDERSARGLPVTREIHIHYSLSGKIQAVEGERLRIHGQWVNFDRQTLRDEGLRIQPGAFVAISGIETQPGQWQASRISNNPGHVVIRSDVTEVDFSPHVHRIIVDRRMERMLRRWQIKKQHRQLFYRWDPAVKRLRVEMLQKRLKWQKRRLQKMQRQMKRQWPKNMSREQIKEMQTRRQLQQLKRYLQQHRRLQGMK